MIPGQCLVVTRTASDSPTPDFPRLLALRNLGVRALRIVPYVPEMIRPDGSSYDFSTIGRVVRAAWSLGFLIKLDFQWLPPAWSEGRPTYMPYLDGTWWYDDPLHDFGKGFHYWGSDPRFAAVDAQIDKSFAQHPTNIDPVKVFDFMRAAASEDWAPYVWMWGTMHSNETGGRDYFPPISFENQLGDTVRSRYMPQLVIPSVRAIRGVIPNAILNIEDADGEDILSRVHEAYYELLSGTAQTVPPVWHLYRDDPGDFVMSCLARVEKKFMPIVRRWRGDGPTFITESGVQGSDTVSDWLAFVRAIHAQYRTAIDGIFALDPKYWFGQSWITGELKLTPEGEAFRELNQEISGKRRAVSK